MRILVPVLALSAACALPASDATRTLTIVHTAHMEGEIEPCG